MINLESNDERNKAALQVKTTLSQIQDSRSLIQFLLPQSNKVYESRIAEIDHVHNHLILDVLNTDDDDKIFPNTTGFIARSRVNGSNITFYTRISSIYHGLPFSVNEDQYLTLCQANLPKQVNFLERRSAYRMYLNHGFAPNIILVTKAGERMQGVVNDISIGGLRATFKQPSVCFWEIGERIAKCTVQLSPKVHIVSGIEIRHSQYNKDDNNLIIGACFTCTNRTLVSSITKYIYAAEREWLRRGISQSD